MLNLNVITYNEDLTISSQTEQSIRAFADQANTIKIKVPVSGYNTAFIIYQGLANGVVNPRLRATERLLMTPLADDGVYSVWQSTIPGSILNDMSLMNCTGVRVLIEFWFLDNTNALGVEKYNTEVTAEIQAALATDYPDATDGQWVRVIDTDTDWYYDLATDTWIDYEDQYQVGIVKAPTSSADFALEKGIYTGAPSHSPTNTELILEELKKMLRHDGSRPMTDDLDMDSNGIDNVGSVTLYNENGNAVLTFNGTNFILNRGAGNETILTNVNNLADLANYIETNVVEDDLIIFNGTNYVNIAKALFLKSTQDQIDQHTSDISDLTTNKEDKSNKIITWGTPTDVEYPSAKLTKDTLDLKEDKTNKGATNGYAPLVSGLIPSAYIPMAYDNYEEVATYADLPTTGRESTVYVVLADETSGGNTSTYRWTGSVYGKISDTLSASEVKTLYESNADTNAYTDSEKTKLGALYTQAQLLSALGLKADTTYVDSQIDSLKAIYGWESSDLTPTALEDEDTLALSAISDYDQLLFVCRNTSTDEIDTQKVPVVELTNGTDIEFFGNSAIVATIDATNITFSDVGTTETLKIYGVKMQQQLAENVATDEENISVQDELNAMNYLKSQLFFYQQNYFNKNNVINNNYVAYANGMLIEQTGYSVTDYIRLNNETNFSFNMTAQYQLAFYDSNKDYIEGKFYSNDGLTISIPITARYFKISIKNDFLDTFMMVSGSTIPTVYKPYSYIPNDTFKIEGKNLIDKSVTKDKVNIFDYNKQYVILSELEIGTYYLRTAPDANPSPVGSILPPIRIEKDKKYTYIDLYGYFSRVIYDNGTDFFLQDTPTPTNVSGSFIAEDDGYMYITVYTQGGVPKRTAAMYDGYVPRVKLEGLYNISFDNVLISNNDKLNQNIVTVKKVNGDYSTLRSCFENIEPSYYNRYIVEIYEGAWVINDEYTTEEWDAADFKGLFVPDYVTLKGVGRKEEIVISAHSGTIDISTLNISNTAHLENLTITGDTLRYVIHDDFADITQPSKFYERNVNDCIFIGNNLIASSVYGAGQQEGAKWKFKNCIFRNITQPVTFSDHNNVNWEIESSIEFENCRFESAGQTSVLRLGSLNTNANNVFTRVTLKGCKVGQLKLIEESALSYGTGILFTVSGFANLITTITIVNTDGEDYSSYIDLI